MPRAKGEALTRGTVVFGSIYPWGSQLRFAAILRKRGFRVERVSASGDATRDKVRSSLERLVYHRVERSLGTDYRRSSLRLGALEQALDADPVDLQLDDWVAAALTEECQDHPNFPRRTRAPFAERDLYDKRAMAGHAAASGWPTPQLFSTLDEPGDWPRIVKPRLGGGGEGVHVVADDDSCRSAVHELGGWSQVIVQEFVTGESVRVGGIARDGKILHPVTYRTVKAPNQPYRPSIGVAATPIPDLAEHARALLAAMGFTGIFSIESIRSGDGQPRFIEMNSRVMGTLAALSSAGIDLVDDYLYAMGAQDAPSGGELHETGTIKVNSIRILGRALGWRWVTADLCLRWLTHLGKHLPGGPK